jgi:NADPH:quinone reductase-like Zn-dependent oxidoreductase
MRAAFHSELGGVEVLRVGDRPSPTCGPDDVLIRVRASSLDRLDVYAREGSHGVRRPLPHIGGRDVAGDVIRVGSAVADRPGGPAVGDPVVAIASTGAHCEIAAAPAQLTFPKPPALSYESAAAIPTAGRSAYDALVNRVDVKAGEAVLVVAGGSGVGSFAIQIARARGCRVITTVGSPDKFGKALELGATDVIDHYAEDVAHRVKELTDGHGVHVVLDHVGAPMWNACFDSLRPFGRFITTGVTAGARAQLHLGRLFTTGVSLQGIGRPEDAHIRNVMLGLLEMIERGLVTPVVHSIYPLEDIRAAHELLESSSFFGKVALTLDGRES